MEDLTFYKAQSVVFMTGQDIKGFTGMHVYRPMHLFTYLVHANFSFEWTKYATSCFGTHTLHFG